jgi:hypothetical protein
MSPTGSDVFDVLDPLSGVYWATPPGSMTMGPNGGPGVSTGSLRFSDVAWSEANSNYSSSNVLELPKATSQEQKDFALAEINDLMNGNYLWSANPASAAAQTPGLTAFGPIFPPGQYGGTPLPVPWPGFPGWWFTGQ